MGNNNVERFIYGSVHYFKLIGFEFEYQHHWKKFLLIAGLINMSVVLMAQVMFVPLSNAELQEKAIGITYINYSFVAVGKIISLLYKRKYIFETLNEFRQIYPSSELEKVYNFQRFLKQYLLIEKFLVRFFQSTTLFYNFSPLIFSLIEFVRAGIFTYRIPLMLWYPFEIKGNWPVYIFAYLQQVFASYEFAIVILGSDLCLFSSLLQLCMQFDIINKNILKIEPDASGEAEKELKVLIAYHQRVLKLSEKVNTIFTLSILFSLLSSSFIICFTGYQLLGNISIIIVAKAVFLLGYELKQVVITCFLGDRLVDISLKTSDAIYEHKWYNGTPKYKCMVLQVLMRSRKSASLNIAGISDISRQTLREVMSFSYQMFTFLKTA